MLIPSLSFFSLQPLPCPPLQFIALFYFIVVCVQETLGEKVQKCKSQRTTNLLWDWGFWECQEIFISTIRLHKQDRNKYSNRSIKRVKSHGVPFLTEELWAIKECWEWEKNPSQGESPIGYPIQTGPPWNHIHAGNTKCTKIVIFIYLHMSSSSWRNSFSEHYGNKPFEEK